MIAVSSIAAHISALLLYLRRRRRERGEKKVQRSFCIVVDYLRPFVVYSIQRQPFCNYAHRPFGKRKKEKRKDPAV